MYADGARCNFDAAMINTQRPHGHRIRGPPSARRPGRNGGASSRCCKACAACHRLATAHWLITVRMVTAAAAAESCDIIAAVQAGAGNARGLNALSVVAVAVATAASVAAAAAAAAAACKRHIRLQKVQETINFVGFAVAVVMGTTAIALRIAVLLGIAATDVNVVSICGRARGNSRASALPPSVPRVL